MERITITNPRGLKLAGLSFTPDSPEPQATPLLIVCHGFTGSKEGKGKALEMARWLVQRGVASVLFDFAGCGQSEGEFKDVTLSHHVEDISSVVSCCRENGWQNIGLLGRSFGGAAALAYTAADPAVRALCTWSAPVHLDRLFGSRPGDLLAPDGTIVRLKDEFFSDLRRHDLLLAAARISPRPLLVIHGTADEVVPVREAEDLFVAAGEPKELVLVPGADHQLSQHYRQAWEAVYRWIQGWAPPGSLQAAQQYP